MADPASLAALAGSGILAVGLASGALLKAWHGWLELRRSQLAGGGGKGPKAAPELAELKARVRRLETIASGGEA